mgnify:CR=1 FL=1
MMTESLDNIVIDNINIEIKSILHINSTLEPIIFLHEGLGSISLWKDFPDKIAKITKRDVIIYSRLGMGNSSSLKEPRNVYYMHQEAKNYLPKILKYLKITNPILFGHSDGASIALIYAGTRGYLDDLDKSRLIEFEEKFYDFLDASCSDLLNVIKTSGELDDKTEEILKTKISDFVKGF